MTNPPLAAPGVADLIPRSVLTLAIHRLRAVANGNALPALADVAADELQAALLAGAAGGEPVAEYIGGEKILWIDGDKKTNLFEFHGIPVGTKLYAHPPAPVVAQGEVTDADPALRHPGPWRVGLFWSSSNPDQKVRCLAESAEQIAEYEKRGDFIQWLAATQPSAAPAEPLAPAFDVSKITASDKFGGTTYSIKVHFLDRDQAEKTAILLCNRKLPSGPYPAQAADQAESIDIDKLELALVWYGCATPTREMISWFVGREVNRLLDRILVAKAERLAAPPPGEVQVDAARKYNELLFAVASKFPGESRHDTALRYIRSAEDRSNESGPAHQAGVSGGA